MTRGAFLVAIALLGACAPSPARDDGRPAPELFSPGTRGVREAKLVVVAGDGSLPVFHREAVTARTVLGRALGDAEAVILSNDPARGPAHLPADQATLARVIADAGRALDGDEDLLVVFLVSHGARSGALKLRWTTVGEAGVAQRWKNDLPPVTLAAMLARAGVAHRLVIVDACYSGHFVDALAAPGTLVYAAAARDRPSFGCVPEAELTVFGRALLEDGLPGARDLDEAFARARARVAEEEAQRGLPPSGPTTGGGELVRPLVQEIWTAGPSLDGAAR